MSLHQEHPRSHVESDVTQKISNPLSLSQIHIWITKLLIQDISSYIVVRVLNIIL